VSENFNDIRKGYPLSVLAALVYKTELRRSLSLTSLSATSFDISAKRVKLRFAEITTVLSQLTEFALPEKKSIMIRAGMAVKVIIL